MRRAGGTGGRGGAALTTSIDVRAELEAAAPRWLYALFERHVTRPRRVGEIVPPELLTRDGQRVFVPLAPHHMQFLEWLWRIERGTLPIVSGVERDAFVEVWSRGHAKALAVDTPLPTPSGWTMMGDLQVGDQVFGEDGRPTRVLAVSPVSIEAASDIRFSDGSSITASDDHLWEVIDRLHPQTHRIDRSDRRTKIETRQVMTTAEIKAAGLRRGQERRWAIPVARPLALETVVLPIHPYLLGAWLGDGDTAGSRITSGFADVAALEEALTERGIAYSRRDYQSPRLRPAGLQRALRDAGLLGRKHIPAAYLRAAHDQRLELLRGLLDTDGSATKTGRTVSLTSTCEPVASGLYELAASLGYRPQMSESRAMLYGKDCGAVWRVTIAGVGPEVFAFPRKQEAVTDAARKALPNSGKVRYITSIEPVGPRPVRCIVVESPNSLFLAGRAMIPTHNSTLAEIAACALGLRRKRRYLLYVSGTQKQADDHLAAIARMLRQPAVRELYPVESDRRLLEFSHGAWRHNRIMTPAFTIDALGLDVDIRGARIDEDRPDAAILDDIDAASDSGTVIETKLSRLTRDILPTLTSYGVVLFVQNLLHRAGICARLVDGRADFLANRIVSGPIPALVNFDKDRDIVAHESGIGWKIVGGTPTWAGYDLEACNTFIRRWGKNAFLAEAQHDLGVISDLVYAQFDPQVHMWRMTESTANGRRTKLPRFRYFVGGLDFGSEGEQAHYSAGVLAGVTEDLRVLILATFRERGAGIASRQAEWMRKMEERIGRAAPSMRYDPANPHASVTWVADRTQFTAIGLLSSVQGFNVVPSAATTQGDQDTARERRVRMTGERLMVRPDGQPGLFYVPDLDEFETEMQTYRRELPKDPEQPSKRRVLRVNDDIVACVEQIVEYVDSPTGERPTGRPVEVQW